MIHRLFLKTAFWALLAGSVLRAEPILLEPGSPSRPDAIDYPSILAATPLASISGPAGIFSPGTVSGTLNTYIYSGIAENPFAGGLTFVYELKNSSLTGTEGISVLEINGWAGIETWVGYGTSLISTTSEFSPVQPGETQRSENGNTITFTFPPGSREPPIFAGQDGMQLILFTNATSWAPTVAEVITNDFIDIFHIRPGTTEILSAATFSPGAVPVRDGGTTVLLLGVTLVAMTLAFSRKLGRSAL